MIKEDSEKKIRRILESHGFCVSAKETSSNGDDILCIKNGVAFKIEVKTITTDKNSFRCRLNDYRAGSDFIICSSSKTWFVYPCKETRFSKVARFYSLLKDGDGSI